MFKQHPKGLPFLFFSEMWERFGYYLMIGIFTLYLKDAKNGFQMTEAEASDLYGTFIAFVFLTPFIGGIIADKWLGYRKSIILGGLMMGAGYCLMAYHSKAGLYGAISLIVLGNGLFKPNISTILGKLYVGDSYRSLKDAGYNIFYMGINIGAFICNFFGAVMQNTLGWGAAFIMAGIGMFIGVGVFMAGTNHYTPEVDEEVKAQNAAATSANNQDMPIEKVLVYIMLPAIVFAAIGYFIPITLVQSKSTDAFIFACIPILFYYVSLYFSAKPEEKRPMAAMLAIFGISIAFWAVFKQNGSALTTWADRYTDRSVAKVVEAPLKSLYLLQAIPTTKDSFPVVNAQFVPKKVNGKIVKDSTYHPYLKNLSPEQLSQAQDGKLYVLNTSIFQSINPAWVVLLTPLVVSFFAMLRRRGKEPTTAGKIWLGLFISALSMLCMVGAVYVSGNGAEKASPGWIISTYFVITIGELCLSPMGLSMVSKLSPPRMTAIMMGGWFLSTSIGNKLSGVLATMWDKYEYKANYFWVNFVLLGIAVLGMLAMIKWLNGIFREHIEK